MTEHKNKTVLFLISVLQRALAVPVHSESSPFIMPVGEVSLTQLQEAILSALQVLHTVSLTENYSGSNRKHVNMTYCLLLASMGMMRPGFVTSDLCQYTLL